MLRTKVILLAGFVVMTGGTARSGLTRIDILPDPIIALGDTVTYTAVIDNLDGPATYQWSMKRTVLPCADAGYYNANESSNVLSRTASDYGFYNIRCEATFYDIALDVFWTEEKDVDIATVLPTTYTPVSGLGVDFTFAYGFGNDPGVGTGTLTFQVWCGSRMLGPQATANVEERIRRPQLNPPYDSGWLGPGANLYLGMGGRIFDIKVISFPNATWNAIGSNNIPFDDFYQDIRIVYGDACGQTHRTPIIGTKHYKKIKTGQNSWQIIEVP